jgi:hypothetical protein
MIAFLKSKALPSISLEVYLPSYLDLLATASSLYLIHHHNKIRSSLDLLAYKTTQKIQEAFFKHFALTAMLPPRIVKGHLQNSDE